MPHSAANDLIHVLVPFNVTLLQSPELTQLTSSHWLLEYIFPLWVPWIISLIWTGSHIWRPKSRRLASTEQIFGTPYYCGLMIDTSVILNRRSDNGNTGYRLDFDCTQGSSDVDKQAKNDTKYESFPQHNHVSHPPDICEEDERTRIMGCATMWHESSEEMAEMIKSLFRIDEDYSAR